MPEKLYVHADLGDGTIVLAGQLIVDEKLGRFKYAKAYLNHARSFALDPINLPLNEEIHSKHRTRDTPAMFGVLIDAGPDEWGRRWLTKTRQPPPVTQVEFLLAASGEGVGALHFTGSLEEPVRPTPERPFENLVHLQHIAADVESGREVDRSLEPYFFHGSGIGGARPKSLIGHDQREWIAKFNRDSDLVDMCRVELASMRMARDAGVDVPDVLLTETERGPVLLVERFDQAPGEQHHLVSVASLINKFDITEIDESTMSYPGITQLGKRIGQQTSDLGAVVFRRMLFNVAVGNTDDHLRNHAFMKRGAESDYSLSPGYDIVPQISLQGSHAIAIGPFGSSPTGENIQAAAKRMGVADELAHQIAAEVLEVSLNWREYMRDAGLGDSDLGLLERCFGLRDVVQRWHEK